jgi:hypothetical protein
MAGKLVNEGRTYIGEVGIKNGTQRGVNSWYLGLYLNTTEPLITATLASGLTELALTGYARIQLNDADWTNVVGVVTNIIKTFVAGEAWGDIYGYFICDVASGTAGDLICVEQFSTGPFNIADTQDLDVTAELPVT